MGLAVDQLALPSKVRILLGPRAFFLERKILWLKTPWDEVLRLRAE